MRDLLFRFVVPLTFTGSLFTLFLLVAWPLFKRLTARFCKEALVCCAVSFLLPLPLLYLLQPSGAATAMPTYQAGYALNQAVQNVAPSLPAPASGSTLGYATQAASGNAVGVTHLLPLIYISGLALILLACLLRYLHFALGVKRHTKPAGGPEQQTLLALCETMDIGRAPALLQSSAFQSPVLLGFWRPAIVLPAGAQTKLALQHELTHYRQKDLWLKILFLAVNILHWFNPLAWVLRRSFFTVCEEACDEKITREMDNNGRMQYADALLHFAGHSVVPPALGFSPKAGQLKKRLQKALRPAAPGRAARAVSAIVLLVAVTTGLLAGCGFSVGAAEPPSTSSLLGNSSSLSSSLSSSVPSSSLPNASSLPGDSSLPDTAPSDDASVPSGTQAEMPTLIFPVPDASYCSRGYLGGRHTGYDINAPTGTSILAAAAGTVTFAGWHWSYGYYVEIDHGGGLSTLYAHNDELFVATGESVEQGQLIAAVGATGNSTGPHCHFEVIVDGEHKDPLGFVSAPW